jgi:threonine/homoserine/homoserine lactone efflux protein
MIHFLQELPAFILATFLLAIIPGQGMAMVIRQVLVGGRRIGFISVLGNSTGLIVWGLASSVGLAAAFAASETAYNALKFAGVAYLMFVAVQTLWTLRTGNSAFEINTSALSQTPLQAYRRGLITNLTNAKAGVFAVAFLPLFVPEDFSVGIGVAILGFVWACVSATSYSIIIYGFDKAANRLTSKSAQRKLTLVSGVGILFLALTLALS